MALLTQNRLKVPLKPNQPTNHSRQWFNIHLATEEQGCEQSARSRYTAKPRLGVEPATSWSHVRRPTLSINT